MASFILASLNLGNCVAMYFNFVYQLTTLGSVFEILLCRKSAIYIFQVPLLSGIANITYRSRYFMHGYTKKNLQCFSHFSFQFIDKHQVNKAPPLMFLIYCGPQMLFRFVVFLLISAA